MLYLMKDILRSHKVKKKLLEISGVNMKFLIKIGGQTTNPVLNT